MNKQFLDSEGRKFEVNIGQIILGQLNGIKHTPESFSKKHNISLESLKKVIKNEKAPSEELIKAISNNSPLRLRDLYDLNYKEDFPIVDDTVDGISYISNYDKNSTKRTFYRGLDKKIPYYDYADTAMTRLSTFRPEWIAERFVFDGSSPNVPDWAFNNGHFEHQMTYFIGEVNFHWKDKDSNKYVWKTKTGDANYIVPFVPHTFSTREEGQGVILAVTYGGGISKEEFKQEIKEYDLEVIISILEKRFNNYDAKILEKNKGVLLAEGRSINPSDKEWGKYFGLIGDVPSQPKSRTERWCLSKPMSRVRYSNDVWIYNIGNNPYELIWDNNSQIVGPGDSFLVTENTYFSLFVDSYVENLVMNISPQESDPWEELNLIHKFSGRDAILRVKEESKLWF